MPVQLRTFLLCVIVLSCQLRTSTICCAAIQVRTTSGIIEGFFDNATRCNMFLGVPYAAPPVGALRLQAPQPHAPWTGVRQTMTFRDGCMQTCTQDTNPLADGCPQTMSEDCLYLNVFTPSTNSSSAKAQRLPVLVWIHGGDFIEGSAGVLMFESPLWAVTQQIVIVSINYRLGVFGGFYHRSAGILGNFHLKDQQFALLWVQKNIASFGGDPGQVTIDGQSAGGISVSAHLAVPSSWPLFHRAIVQSNPYGVLCPTANISTDLSRKIATHVKCNFSNPRSLLTCLQNVSATDLLEAQNSEIITPWPSQLLQLAVQWSPVVEENISTAFLPVQPLFAATSHNGSYFAKDKPILIGNVVNETAGFIYQFLSSPLPQLELDLIVMTLFGLTTGLEILKFYGPGKNVSDTRDLFSRLGTDYLFLCPTRFAATQYSAQGRSSVYSYMYSHTPSFAPYYNTLNGTGICNTLTCHAIELPILFNNEYECRAIPNASCFTPSRPESVLSNQMQTYWSNFVKFGNPNHANLSNVHGAHKETASKGAFVEWPLYDTSTRLSLNLTVLPWLGVVARINDDTCNFFDSIGYNRR